MLRGKSKVNTLAANAAGGVRDAKHSPSRVVLSLKVRLCLQTCRCEFSAAFHSGQTTGASSTGAPRSKSVPKNSLQLLAIPQSLDQWGGHLCFPAPCNAPVHKE